MLVVAPQVMVPALQLVVVPLHATHLLMSATVGAQSSVMALSHLVVVSAQIHDVEDHDLAVVLPRPSEVLRLATVAVLQSADLVVGAAVVPVRGPPAVVRVFKPS